MDNNQKLRDLVAEFVEDHEPTSHHEACFYCGSKAGESHEENCWVGRFKEALEKEDNR